MGVNKGKKAMDITKEIKSAVDRFLEDENVTREEAFNAITAIISEPKEKLKILERGNPKGLFEKEMGKRRLKVFFKLMEGK